MPPPIAETIHPCLPSEPKLERTSQETSMVPRLQLLLILNLSSRQNGVSSSQPTLSQPQFACKPHTRNEFQQPPRSISPWSRSTSNRAHAGEQTPAMYPQNKLIHTRIPDKSNCNQVPKIGELKPAQAKGACLWLGHRQTACRQEVAVLPHPTTHAGLQAARVLCGDRSQGG